MVCIHTLLHWRAIFSYFFFFQLFLLVFSHHTLDGGLRTTTHYTHFRLMFSYHGAGEEEDGKKREEGDWGLCLRWVFALIDERVGWILCIIFYETRWRVKKGGIENIDKISHMLSSMDVI